MTDKPDYKRVEIQKLFDKSDELFDDHIKTPELKMHCKEVEIIMRFLAKELGEDEEEWAICGRLHDLDYEDTKDKINEHGKLTAFRLKENNFPLAMQHAILSHNEENTGIKRENKFDYCLAAADNISGLIYAYGLMRKNLSGMEIKGLKKKIKDKTFAAAVRRDLIYDIEKFMELDKFLEISIKAMQSISSDIGFNEVNTC